MTTTTTTLADFLLARYDECEARIHGRRRIRKGVVYEMRPQPWHSVPHVTVQGVGEMSDDDFLEQFGEYVETPEMTFRLAELAAKRRIVELHSMWSDGRRWGCGTCSAAPGEINGLYYEFDTPACPTLRALAQPYADHADFREEWRA